MGAITGDSHVLPPFGEVGEPQAFWVHIYSRRMSGQIPNYPLYIYKKGVGGHTAFFFLAASFAATFSAIRSSTASRSCGVMVA